jgi:heat shock protein HslJ
MRAPRIKEKRMKRQIIIFVLAAVLIISCAGTRGNIQNISDISGIEGKEWNLTQVYVNGVDIQFRRDSQPEMFRDIFTLNFDGQMVNGTGAPNLYSAPYTLGENRAISISLMRTTLMAALFEPDNLSEHEFFNFLQSAYSWEIVNNNLILSSRTQDGQAVRLVFAL